MRLVAKSTVDASAGEVLVTVSGTGYSTTFNGGVGVYVSFGPQPVGARAGNTAFTDATRYYDGGAGKGTIWVTPGTPSGTNQAKLQADGTFSIQMAVKSSYVGADSTSYAHTSHTLGVLTYAAHGMEASAAENRSQYVFVPVTFATAPSAPAAPTLSGATTSSLDVSWTAPSTGGSPITGYTVTLCRNTSAAANQVAATVNVDGTMTSTTVSALDSDSSYNAKVSATNAIGTSTASAASTVTRTLATPVTPALGGLRWKVSHQAWTSSSLSVHEVSGGATKTTDGFLFPSASVTFDQSTGALTATFSGTASVGNTNQGGYRIYLADPILTIAANDAATLSALVSYRTSAAGPVSTPVRATVLSMTIPDGSVSVSGGGLSMLITPGGTFDSAFIGALDASLRGHFQATNAASDPLKVPSPFGVGVTLPPDPTPTPTPEPTETPEPTPTPTPEPTETPEPTPTPTPEPTETPEPTPTPTPTPGTTGRIRITVDLKPSSGTDITFTGDLGTFWLDDDANASLAATRSVRRAPGTYKVTQQRATGWQLQGIVCSDGSTTNVDSGRATIRLSADELVECVFTNVRRRADVLIAPSTSGSFAGNGVYRTQVISAQTREASVARGGTTEARIRVQNDGPIADTFKLRLTLGGSSSYKARFFLGSQDITSALRDGTYRVRGLAPGTSATIRVVLTAAADTARSAVRTIDLRATSTNLSSATDIVRLRVVRR